MYDRWKLHIIKILENLITHSQFGPSSAPLCLARMSSTETDQNGLLLYEHYP